MLGFRFKSEGQTCCLFDRVRLLQLKALEVDKMNSEMLFSSILSINRS